MYSTATCHTFCSVCHKPNDTYEQYRKCTHDHTIERWIEGKIVENSGNELTTPQQLRTYETLLILLDNLRRGTR